jgi:hypothetical protein
LEECENDKLADHLKNQILEKLFIKNYDAIDSKYL